MNHIIIEFCLFSYSVFLLIFFSYFLELIQEVNSGIEIGFFLILPIVFFFFCNVEVIV